MIVMKKLITVEFNKTLNSTILDATDDFSSLTINFLIITITKYSASWIDPDICNR